MKTIKYIGLLGCLGVSIALTGCTSYKPKPQSALLYHAPAQAFTLDLSSQVFRGKVSTADSCAPEGSSLDVIDSEGQFFRVDAINLVNNPKLELPEFSDDPTVRELVFNYYVDTVNPGGKVIEQQSMNSRMGASLYGVVQFNTAKGSRHMGYLIVRRGNFAYAIQHEQVIYRPSVMKELLGLISSDIKIPGILPKNKTQSDLPLYIDLKNATPTEVADWRKRAQCN